MPQLEVFIITEHEYWWSKQFKSQNRTKVSKQGYALWGTTLSQKAFDFKIVKCNMNSGGSVLHPCEFKLLSWVCSLQALITQTRAKQAATMSEVEWRGRTVPVKIDKVRIFLLGLADNEAAIAQVTQQPSPSCPSHHPLSSCALPGTWTKSFWVISFYFKLGAGRLKV